MGDTEDRYTLATERVCMKYNRTFNWDIKSQIIGLPAIEAAKKQVILLDLPITPEEYLEERNEQLMPLLTESDFLPGARELLYKLKDQGIPCALATSSPKKLFDLKITKVRKDFEEVFGDRIVCGDDIPTDKGKPNPLIFFEALK